MGTAEKVVVPLVRSLLHFSFKMTGLLGRRPGLDPQHALIWHLKMPWDSPGGEPGWPCLACRPTNKRLNGWIYIIYDCPFKSSIIYMVD